MFKKPTVFILGAGASWHYGYPIGEDLVKNIQQYAELLVSTISDIKNDNPYVPQYVIDETERLYPQAIGTDLIPYSKGWDELISPAQGIEASFK